MGCAKQYIDIHIHVFGDNNGEGQCSLSPKMRGLCMAGTAFGFLANVPMSLNDEDVRDRILDEIRSSKCVKQGVLLAFDKPYDAHGQPMQPALYTPNNWVATICSENPDCALFGASVHPYRQDALKELAKVKKAGAVLVKWIPSSQNILPIHDLCRPFYKKLVELKLPLLCHVGDEHTIAEAGGDQSLKANNHPELLIPALDAGVTVIMAHCALPITDEDNDFSEAFLRMMGQADARGWKLYADVSALVGGWKRSFMAKLMALRVPHDRLVMGSDWPNLPKLDNTFRTDGNSAEIRRIKALENILDRNVEYLRFLGFSEVVMTNAAAVLGMA
ncbi:putative metal-dependent hydrolase superfamily protein [Megalodesulfovibrio gigas DSM 1382 = ATCC 19364]|uniref:Putative metal-dependent hydrolase superfamily protein n=2 Tax=Megalodesulfovibrio gigas TaxID=879 RepID=T2GFK1_MEGG1|nr:putative metal-dependent hydrolase superfamily protein [Megalodesulfovibrio gigas DSM 1382 = ATCC 19364]